MTTGTEPVRETAERVGLAAEVLPGVSPTALVEALMAEVGTPLTTARLDKVSIAGLGRRLVDGAPALDREWLRQAVCYLRGIPAEQAEAPRPHPETTEDSRRALRVAFASDSGENLDGHFGGCLDFLIYDVNASTARLVGVRPTDAVEGQPDPSEKRVALIDDCHMVYVNAIGGPAAAKVVRVGIYPLKVTEPQPIYTVLTDLQDALYRPRMPWMAEALGVAPERSETISEEIAE